MNFDPLVDVAFSNIHESSGQLDEEQILQIKMIFQDYITKNKNYQECKESLFKYINTVQPLDKIKNILDVEDEPIPLSPVTDDNNSNARKKTRTWTNIEDARLLKGIHKLGLESWNEVAQYVGNGRTRSQCSQRWIRVLDPRISKSNWTKEEENRLIELVMIYGEKSWAKVSSKMGNRSDVQCRYRYQQIPKAQRLQHQKEVEGDVSIADSSIRSKHKTASNKAKRSTPTPVVQAQTQNLSLSHVTPQSSEQMSSTSLFHNGSEEHITTTIDNSNIQPNPMMFTDELKLDEKIPLGASCFDLFKSDQLFDTSFWV